MSDDQIAINITEELIGQLAETIVVQTSGPIFLSKRFPVPGSESYVVLGGEAHISCARAIARNVLQRLLQISEKQRKP